MNEPILDVLRFAELGGFVILDVEGIERSWRVSPTEPPRNLLTELADMQAVEAAAQARALLPIIVEPDDYRLRLTVGDDGDAPAFTSILGQAEGWRLCAGSLGQQLLGIGYLAKWSRSSDGAQHFRLEPGEYTLHVHWGLRGDEACIDLRLVPCTADTDARELPVELAF